MKFILTLILTSIFVKHAYSQSSEKKDSIHIEIREDSLRRKTELDYRANYEVRIYFFGFFDKDTIKIARNEKLFCSDIISNRSNNGNYESMIYTDNKLIIKIREKRNDVFKLYFNNHVINLDFRYGYSDLTINVSQQYNKMDNQNIYSFLLNYTSDFVIMKY
ncbi:hypothetical protein [Chitinophaga sp.]|uniref:hypothetical protein n=1 Tax=Chitinophaga sp. TaxID=1869181 RepID=UPI0031DDB0E3